MVTRAIRSVHRYDGRAPVASLRKVIDAARPDLILPLCDRGVQHMHQLYWLSRRSTGGNAGVADLIERSIGSSACYDVVSSRYRLLQVARNEGILTPEMSQIEVRGDSVPQLGRTNLPWVVKADGTSGGRGVRIANTPDETRRAIRELGQRPGLVELAKRMLLNRDRDWIIADWKLVHRDLLIQAHIDGRPANCAVACWEGQVLAGACFEVLAAQGPKEPASIVRVIEHQAMIDTVRKMARRLQLSGFIGFDFMIENGTGAAYLIEMNP
ncbi:MAG TPA: hypothetical protein VJU82_10515, partial [Acidobacteriaceae bacterium]|nr:hypothetical protein [Acidobacteriaceae bacterium]